MRWRAYAGGGIILPGVISLFVGAIVPGLIALAIGGASVMVGILWG